MQHPEQIIHAWDDKVNIPNPPDSWNVKNIFIPCIFFTRSSVGHSPDLWNVKTSFAYNFYLTVSLLLGESSAADEAVPLPFFQFNGKFFRRNIAVPVRTDEPANRKP
jgi:hypothetical protein